jgi:hypothetical protein
MDTSVIIETIGQRKIRQLEVLYNNKLKHRNDMELLVLITCAEEGGNFLLFGGPIDGDLRIYQKHLLFPMSQRSAALIGFIRFDKGICLCIFEDGEVVKLRTECDHGVEISWRLDMQFDKANMTVYDSENQILCIQSIERSRSIYQYETKGSSGPRWSHLADHSNTKWTFYLISGKFVVARNLDKYTYLLELSEIYEIQNQVRIGEDDSWNYQVDASAIYSQFVILYEKLGKSFHWQ